MLKIQVEITLLLLSIFIAIGCKKESGNTEKQADYIKITVNGKTYNNQIFSGGSGFTNQSGCISKPHYLSYMGLIENSSLYADFYIKHLENDIDFKTSSTGNHKIVSNILGSSCNLDLIFSYKDKTLNTQTTTILPGSLNTITKIKMVSSTSTEIQYTISGTFSCSVKNASNVSIPISGDYQTTIYTYK